MFNLFSLIITLLNSIHISSLDCIFRHSLIFTNHKTYIGNYSFNSMNHVGRVLNDYLSLNGDDGAEI